MNDFETKAELERVKAELERVKAELERVKASQEALRATLFELIADLRSGECIDAWAWSEILIRDIVE